MVVLIEFIHCGNIEECIDHDFFIPRPYTRMLGRVRARVRLRVRLDISYIVCMFDSDSYSEFFFFFSPVNHKDRHETFLVPNSDRSISNSSTK